jgi:two-component system phosphate regulon sensor histidine kinase PhoR
LTWLSTSYRIALLLAAAAAIGWYYGYPLHGVTIALVGLVVHWLYQMRRVQLWLSQTEQPPPEIYGIWGELLGQIYQRQKKSREDRARLQSTVDYLRDSFASMRDGVAIIDEHGVLKWFNEFAQRLLGLRAADQGQSLMNLVRSPEFLAYVNEGQYKEPLQYRSAGESGAYLRVEITRFGDGDRLLFIRDVTASVRMEQVRKDFVANVSHELRTPLTVITGYLGTFLSEPDKVDPRFIKPLQQMLQQAGRMENLLKDLLWLARIESEPGDERRGVVDVPALLTELQDELKSSHPGRSVSLDLQVGARQKVLGDYRELYSAASNLLLNALKYSPQDSEVKVSWQCVDGSCRLAVSDQGIGIEASQVPRLTERFYRVEDSRSADTGGTGLGLAIVKHVAATHGARLEIDSQPGRGSTFTLVFPEATQAGMQAGLSAGIAAERYS